MRTQIRCLLAVLSLTLGCSQSSPTAGTGNQKPPVQVVSPDSNGDAVQPAELNANGSVAADPAKKPATPKTDGATTGPASGAPAEKPAPPKTDSATTGPDEGVPATKPAPEETVEGLLAKATAAAQRQDFLVALENADRALEKAPNHRGGLALVALAAQQRGMALAQGGNDDEGYPLFLKSAEAMRKLRKVKPELTAQEKRMVPVILYNEACAYCKVKEPNLEKAIASFKDAADAGFADLAQVDKDTDLDPIRERPEFKDIRAQIETNKQ